MGFKKRSDSDVNIAVPSVSNQQSKRSKKIFLTIDSN